MGSCASDFSLSLRGHKTVPLFFLCVIFSIFQFDHVYIRRFGIFGHQLNSRLEFFAPCTVPSTGGFSRKPNSTLVSKNLTKKIRETRKLESIYE